MLTCSTRVLDHATSPRPAVSYGYDQIASSIRCRSETQSLSPTRSWPLMCRGLWRTGTVTATNQHGEVVAVATHILKFL